MADVEGPVACEVCGRQLPVQQGRGRRRRYCDATCRSSARRQRALAQRRGRGDVKGILTLGWRHGTLDAAEDVPDGADPIAIGVSDTARRLVDEFTKPGTS